MFDLITENKGAVAVLATIIVSNVGLYLLYNIHSNKQCDQLRKSEKIYDDNGKELKRLPIHKFLFTLLQDKKIKDLYLKKSHELRDLFEVPQKELTISEYDKENDTITSVTTKSMLMILLPLKFLKNQKSLNKPRKTKSTHLL